MKINPSEYKILIVDDVAPNVLLLKALLGREKYNIVSATSGKRLWIWLYGKILI